MKKVEQLIKCKGSNNTFNMRYVAVVGKDLYFLESLIVYDDDDRETTVIPGETPKKWLDSWDKEVAILSIRDFEKIARALGWGKKHMEKLK